MADSLEKRVTRDPVGHLGFPLSESLMVNLEAVARASKKDSGQLAEEILAEGLRSRMLILGIEIPRNLKAGTTFVNQVNSSPNLPTDRNLG